MPVFLPAVARLGLTLSTPTDVTHHPERPVYATPACPGLRHCAGGVDDGRGAGVGARRVWRAHTCRTCCCVNGCYTAVFRGACSARPAGLEPFHASTAEGRPHTPTHGPGACVATGGAARPELPSGVKCTRRGRNGAPAGKGRPVTTGSGRLFAQPYPWRADPVRPLRHRPC